MTEIIEMAEIVEVPEIYCERLKNGLFLVAQASRLRQSTGKMPVPPKIQF